MSSGTFVITDGTTRIDILKTFHLVDWTPLTPGVKGEGVWVSSPFTEGRQQVLREYDNVVDTLALVARSRQSADHLIRVTQDLRRLLEKAASYWLLEWQNEPVWIETRGICETNTRYAIIHDYRAPNDDNPFAPPYVTSSLFDNFSLVLEHGIWQDVAPGSSTCLEISGTPQFWCYPFYLTFDGINDEVNCGSNAAVDDLPAADFTVDLWVHSSSVNTIPLISKRRWYLYLDVDYIMAKAFFDVTNANAISDPGTYPADGDWHHVAAVWDSAAKGFTLYIDGVEPTYFAANAGANNYTSDAAENLEIGFYFGGDYYDGDLGWTRISTNQRFTADFAASIPPRCKIPEIDANTLGLWIYEGTGNTAHNKEGTAALDGTITGATWGCDCEAD